MIRQALIASLVVLLGVAVSWAQEPPATNGQPLSTSTAVEGDTQDFVFLDATRPVFMRLHVQIDGVGFREVWRRYAEKSFNYADANNDGTLTAGEIQNASRSGLMPVSAANLKVIDASPRNGRVSREEWVVWMARSSDIAFSSANQQQQQQASRVRRLGYGQVQQNPGNQLWQHLDRDRDSILTKEELLAAGRTLRKLDLDDDEIIGAGELNPYANPFANRFFFSRPRSGPVRQPAGLSLMAISPRGNRSALAQQLLARYDRQQGKVKDRKLSRKEIALEPAAFDEADADGDGYLDTEELTHMVRRPRPQLALLVRLGEDSRKLGKFALVKAKGEASPMDSSVRLNPGGTLTVVLGTVHIQFSASNPVNAMSNVKFYEAQFKSADRDNNGYLDKKEIDGSPYFRNQAAQMDRDKNGDVYLNEVTAYVKQRAEITMSRIAARGTDQGKLLFDVMDSNRDRRLSQRELAAAPNKLPLWDRNLDGKLVAAEIPHQYSIAITRGGGSGGVALPVPAATASSRNRPRPVPAASPMTAPAWFTKMDRNRDGDLSPREFLGGRQAFDELDANGDGLLDAREAANAG